MDARLEGADLYIEALRRLTIRAVSAAEALAEAPPAMQLVHLQCASEMVRRNAITDRHLREPIRSHPSPSQARRQIIRGVTDRIHRARLRPERVEALERETLERLEGPDLQEDLDSGRPIPEIVAELCADFALDPALHKRRTPTDIARLCARASAGPDPAREPTGQRLTPPYRPERGQHAALSDPLQPAFPAPDHARHPSPRLGAPDTS